jgi:hypothetical protein
MSGFVLEKDGTVGIIDSIICKFADTFSDNIPSELISPLVAFLPKSRRKKSRHGSRAARSRHIRPR